MNPLRVLIRTYILSRPARRAVVKTDTPYAVWVRLGWAERSTQDATLFIHIPLGYSHLETIV